MRILIDLDSICVDLLTPWLGTYNEMFDDCLSVDDITDWQLAGFIKTEEKKAFFQIIKEPLFFRNLEAIPGAKEAVHTLRARHEVRLVSAPFGLYSYTDKAWWVRQKLGLDHSSLVLMPGNNKHWLQADVLIDDKPETLMAWKATWPDAKSATIAYPYNQEFSHLVDCYAPDHKHTEQAWKQIVSYIERLSAGDPSVLS